MSQGLEKLYPLIKRAQQLEQELQEVRHEIARVAASLDNQAKPPKAAPPPRGGLRDAIRGHMKAKTRYTTKEVAEALQRFQSEVGDAMARMADLKRVARSTFMKR